MLESGDAVPSLPAESRDRAVAAMRMAATQRKQSLLHRMLGREDRKMTRLVYALGFLALIGAVMTGMFTRSRPPDAQSILVGAAQAMEDAKTIHIRGRASGRSPEGYPWGQISENSYEQWYTPRGSRMDSRDSEGNLISSAGHDIESGRAWTYGWYDQWFGGRGVFKVFQVAREHLERADVRSRERVLEGERWFANSVHSGAPTRKRPGAWRGRRVTVLEIQRQTPDGDPLGTTEVYLDDRGRLLGYRAYSPPEYGRTLTAEMELVEYDVEPPADLFAMVAPPGVPVIEDFAEPYPGEEIVEVDYFSSSYGPRYRVAPSPAWRARASSSAVGSRPEAAIDGDYDTRWTARGRRSPQEAGAWLEVLFDTPVSANKLLAHNYRDRWAELSAPGPAAAPATGGPHAGTGAGASGPALVEESRWGSGWPRGAQVSITTDGVAWEEVVTGQAAADRPLYANFGGVRDILGLRIMLTEPCDEEPWSIAEINLYGPPH